MRIKETICVDLKFINKIQKEPRSQTYNLDREKVKMGTLNLVDENHLLLILIIQHELKHNLVI